MIYLSYSLLYFLFAFFSFRVRFLFVIFVKYKIMDPYLKYNIEEKYNLSIYFLKDNHTICLKFCGSARSAMSIGYGV